MGSAFFVGRFHLEKSLAVEQIDVKSLKLGTFLSEIHRAPQ